MLKFFAQQLNTPLSIHHKPSTTSKLCRPQLKHLGTQKTFIIIENFTLPFQDERSQQNWVLLEDSEDRKNAICLFATDQKISHIPKARSLSHSSPIQSFTICTLPIPPQTKLGWDFATRWWHNKFYKMYCGALPALAWRNNLDQVCTTGPDFSTPILNLFSFSASLFAFLLHWRSAWLCQIKERVRFRTWELWPH